MAGKINRREDTAWYTVWIKTKWRAREKEHSTFPKVTHLFPQAFISFGRIFILSMSTSIFSPNSPLEWFFFSFYFYWKITVDFTAVLARFQVPHCTLHCWASWLTSFEVWDVRYISGVRVGENLCFHLQHSLLSILWNTVVRRNLISVSIETEVLGRTWEAT